MYSEKDIQSITAQLKKRYIAVLVPAAALICLFVYGLIMHLNRNESYQWLSYVSLTVAGVFLLFTDGLFIAPLRAYKRHLKDALHGRTRQTKGYFKSIDPDPCVRENVTFYPVLVSDHDLQNEEDDRLFYFDAEKVFPSFTVGEKVVVTSHDKRIANIVRA